MNILITGGSGLIGRNLVPRLLTLGHEVIVVTRQPDKTRRLLSDKRITLWRNLAECTSLDGIDAVINLAGEPIAEKRWTEAQKQLICQSRWKITERLVALFSTSKKPPSVLISGSAIGYYGNLGEMVITEDEPPHHEFTHEVCARWERIASQVQNEQTRVCLMRTGVVLSSQGGILGKLLPLFRMGLGGPVGDGHQYISWIHIDDMVNAMLWLLDNDLRGPFNMVSPYPVRNEQFAHALGRVLHRPAMMRAPVCAVRQMMGESAVMVLGGQRVLPKRLEESGFSFRWYELDEALADAVK